MTSVPSARIRNVALVGHGGAGKTTLAEALLFMSGTINRKGRVEDGTTVCDFEPEELKRHISVSMAFAPFSVEGHKLNVIDTPGFADFLIEVELALSVADLAVVVVSAVEGVEVQTEVVWRLAQRAGIPRLIFINKLDRERASFERTLEQLRAAFGGGVAPLELPIGEESGLVGIADLLADEAIFYANGKSSHGPIPDEMAKIEHRVRDNLVEGIVVGDDALMERYLDGDTPSMAELEATLARGVADATVFPVVCGSAATGIGVDRLATLICEVAPSPLDRPPIDVHAGDRTVQVAADPAGDPLALVFKTIVDPFVGKVSFLKVLSGTLRPDITLVNPRTRSEERLHILQMLRGKESSPLSEALAGDIIAVPKLAETQAGDTLAPRSAPVTASLPTLSTPVLSIAVHPRTAGDDDRLMTGLHRLQDEDLALSVRRDDETHQTILSGLGETHLQVVCERLQRKFGVEVEIEELRIPYRETITKPAEAEGRHKKQTGGHGQFGVVHLKVEPLGRGEGFVFVDAIVGGAIPRQFIPAVEKGIQKAMRHGGYFGFPVVDVKVTCDDGKYHSVDSSEASFELAGALAFGEALRLASPVPLEPMSRLEVTVPSRYQGDVLGDLNSRRGRVLGTDAGEADEQVVVALVPTSELQRYAVDLRSITGGRGRFTTAHDHYAAVPAHIAEKLAGVKAGAH